MRNTTIYLTFYVPDSTCFTVEKWSWSYNKTPCGCPHRGTSGSPFARGARNVNYEFLIFNYELKKIKPVKCSGFRLLLVFIIHRIKSSFIIHNFFEPGPPEKLFITWIPHQGFSFFKKT
jgi:hypothetical protein